MGLFYRAFKALNQFALKIYFKKIRIEGIENIPKASPLIFAPNHQNSFLDALLVGAFAPVHIHFLTRSDVFTWWSRPLMKLINMMPIYRMRDGFGKLSENERIFKECAKLFNEGKSVLIFPEGSQADTYYLRPITKGTARLALQAQQSMKEDLKIIPVGLNYFDPQHPNSVVLIVFGRPISVKDYLNDYIQSGTQGLIRMRDIIASAMKGTLVIPEKNEDYQKYVKTIFQPINEDLSLAHLREIEPDSNLVNQQKLKSHHWLSKILNPVPFLIISKVVRRVDDTVFHSSLKYSIALACFPLWWIISFTVVSLFFGIIPAFFVVLLMIITLISYKWWK